MFLPLRRSLLFTVVVFASACGQSPTTPTTPSAPDTGGPTPSPTPSPSPPPAPTPMPLTAPVLTVSSVQRRPGDPVPANFAERAVTFSWTAVPGATSYLAEIGRQSGGADVLSQSLATTSLSTSLFPTSLPGSGIFVYPRVTARNENGAGPPSAANDIVRLLSLQDYVEGLFLGTGPFSVAAPFTGCSASGMLSGWPAGTNVTVTLASSVNSSLLPTADAWARHTRDATAGAMTARARTSPDPHPDAAQGEIVVEQSDAPCGDRNNGGCFQPQTQGAGVYSRGKIQFRSSNGPLAHELGHALGFCHTDGWAGLVSMMSGAIPATSGMAEADIIATRAVYAAGLRAGAARSQFVSAGLIR